ncbi:hypothetical protein PMAYCL1PPCAC_03749, partial [Pristionchus mayeri]
LLLLLPSLIYAGCGCSDEDMDQSEMERKMDEEVHACRSCFQPIQMSYSACPIKGYECYEDWPITPKVLTPNEACRCAEAKCSGDAKLAVLGRIVNSSFSATTVHGR